TRVGWPGPGGHEHDAARRRVEVGAPGGAGPLERPVGQLTGSPAELRRYVRMLQSVVGEAEVGEVVGAGGAAAGAVDGVVGFAAVDGHAAAGETAVLIAGAQVSAHRL